MWFSVKVFPGVRVGGRLGRSPAQRRALARRRAAFHEGQVLTVADRMENEPGLTRRTLGPVLAFGGLAALIASMVLTVATGDGMWSVMFLPGALISASGSRYWTIMRDARGVYQARLRCDRRKS